MMVNSVFFDKTPLTLFFCLSFHDIEYVTDILKKCANLMLKFVFRQNGRIFNLVILS